MRRGIVRSGHRKSTVANAVEGYMGAVSWVKCLGTKEKGLKRTLLDLGGT